MEDVQKNKPKYEYPIQRVGITNLKIPITISEQNGGSQNTVADVDVFVNLKAESKGTHMSRLAIGVQKFISHKFNAKLLEDIAEYIRVKCEADTSEVIYKFPYFIKKVSPVSNKMGLIHCDVTFNIIKSKNKSDFTMSVESTTTSLCPCSKGISDYGAHNQRSKVEITCCPEKDGWIWIEELIKIAEDSSSCEIYSVLKRPDEKYVTERAYNNPKFVEDIIRSIFNRMNKYDNIQWFKIEVSNEESIHQHNAYAKIDTRI